MSTMPPRSCFRSNRIRGVRVTLQHATPHRDHLGGELRAIARLGQHLAPQLLDALASARSPAQARARVSAWCSHAQAPCPSVFQLIARERVQRDLRRSSRRQRRADGDLAGRVRALSAEHGRARGLGVGAPGADAGARLCRRPGAGRAHRAAAAPGAGPGARSRAARHRGDLDAGSHAARSPEPLGSVRSEARPRRHGRTSSSRSSSWCWRKRPRTRNCCQTWETSGC